MIQSIVSIGLRNVSDRIRCRSEEATKAPLEKGPRTTLGLIPPPSKRLNQGYVGIDPFRSSGRSIPKTVSEFNTLI